MGTSLSLSQQRGELRATARDKTLLARFLQTRNLAKYPGRTQTVPGVTSLNVLCVRWRRVSYCCSSRGGTGSEPRPSGYGGGLRILVSGFLIAF